ncbi:MAG: hypothetical protein KKD33_03890 [Verrucomicrobia bacterium]|nr:hypothetical protein [Verrucomicrobiota bacterium]
MRTILLGLLLAGLVGFSALAGEEWLTDINKAKKEAAEKKLPILADFSGSAWPLSQHEDATSQRERTGLDYDG